MVVEPPALSPGKLKRVREQIPQARKALQAGCMDYFLNRLPNPEKVRVLPHVLERAGFLDIETDGLGSRAQVTTVALVRGGRARAYVRGENLDDLLVDLAGLDLLVTYNGASFDLLVLRRTFRIDLATPHLDLRYCLGALGYRGGLKACGKALGVRRTGEVRDGAEAVTLWERYRAGDEAALVSLVRYNLEDALSLEQLAVKAYNMVMQDCPRPTRLVLPPRVEVTRLGLEDVL